MDEDSRGAPAKDETEDKDVEAHRTARPIAEEEQGDDTDGDDFELHRNARP